MNKVVLFGITGDLAKQKLIPALFKLYSNGLLPKDSRFFGFGRKAFSRSEFGLFIDECLQKKNGRGGDILIDPAEIADFFENFEYIQSELDDDKGYKELAGKIDEEKDKALFFLSLPPQFQATVSEKLIKNNVLGRKFAGTRKIALEKPFGYDSRSAVELQNLLSLYLDESQILRVDHYAAKQALIDLETAAYSGIFDGMLGKENVKSIEITFNEEIDVSNRGLFYDSVGALNDVLQNHVLHILGTVLVLPVISAHVISGKGKSVPSLTISKIRGEMLKGLKLLANPKPVLGQYKGYRDSVGVKKDSQTETFFDVRAELGHNIWKGTKVRLTGGKALKKSEVSVALELKRSKKKIKILVNNSTSSGHVASVKLDAHERIFLEALNVCGIGDSSKNICNTTDESAHFISFDQSMAGWRFVEKIKKIKHTFVIYPHS